MHTVITLGNAHLALSTGNVYKLTVDVGVTVTDSISSNDLYFDLGRNVDQLGIRPTVSNQYFPAFNSPINVKAGIAVSFTAGVDVTITDLGPGVAMTPNDTEIALPTTTPVSSWTTGAFRQTLTSIPQRIWISRPRPMNSLGSWTSGFL